MVSFVLALLLQIPGPLPVPSEWIALNNQTPLEASGPIQAIKIPVEVWDSEGDILVAPDVSFSYSITASDKDTFRRTTISGTSETQLFPQGVNLLPLELQYTVVGGNSGYANGTFTWVFGGQGILVHPKPKKEGVPPLVQETVPAKTYVNRHKAVDTVELTSVLKDEYQIVNVVLNRGAYTIWKNEGTIPGG